MYSFKYEQEKNMQRKSIKLRSQIFVFKAKSDIFQRSIFCHVSWCSCERQTPSCWEVWKELFTHLPWNLTFLWINWLNTKLSYYENIMGELGLFWNWLYFLYKSTTFNLSDKSTVIGALTLTSSQALHTLSGNFDFASICLRSKLLSVWRYW